MSTNKTSGTQIVNIKSIKADLALPTGWARFTFGAKASFIGNTSDNSFATYYSGAYINDLSRSNRFEYTENTQALYGSIEKTFKKLGVQAGLRAENTQAKGYSPTLALSNDYKYLKLFPSVFFQYSFSDDNELDLNFTRRIQRPDFMLLNPFRYYSNNTSYETGNPFLQPSYSNNVELGYTFKSEYTLNFFFQRVTDLFAQVMNVDTSGDGFNFTNANVGAELNYGLSINAVINPVPAWESAIEFYAYYTHFSSFYYDIAAEQSYTRPSFNISTNNTFFLNRARTLSAELDLDYEAKELSQFSLQYQTFNMEAGLKALFLRKRLTIALNVEDIFATDRYKLRNLYNGSITNNYGDERTLRFSIGYKFGMLANVKTRVNTSGIEERQGLSKDKRADN
jgi:outer membrane receptor protein involved in Fe transport